MEVGVVVGLRAVRGRELGEERRVVLQLHIHEVEYLWTLVSLPRPEFSAVLLVICRASQYRHCTGNGNTR